MEKMALELYETMQADLYCCRARKLPPVAEIEACYVICNCFRAQLEDKLRDFRFDKPDDEVHFFKTVKPLFVAEIEFQHLVYHSQLFRPSDPVDLLYFWKREKGRFEKFCEENSEFLDYYRAGKTGLDKTYFLRAANGEEGNASTAGEVKIGHLKALEMYSDYVKGQL
jgi:hypothetical protein